MITEPIIAASGVSGLIVLAILIAFAIISSFFKKKAESEESWELPPELKPRRDELPPVARPISRWEEELRRTLEQRPVPAAPPPIIHQLPPREVQPVYRHVHEDPTAQEQPHIEVALPVPQPRIAPVFHPLTGLKEAAQHYVHAANLQERVQQHLHEVTTHRVAATAVTSVIHPKVAPQFRELVDSFRAPGGAKAAIVASIIFGPPRGFET